MIADLLKRRWYVKIAWNVYYLDGSFGAVIYEAEAVETPKEALARAFLVCPLGVQCAQPEEGVNIKITMEWR